MKTEDLFMAVKLTEGDGIDAFRHVEKLVGRKVALALLTAHLRKTFTESDSYPVSPVIEMKVVGWLERNNLLQINSFKGEYRFLSNFWLVNVEFEDVTYPSVEHAYQAAKTTDQALREKMRNMPESGDVKEASQTMEVRPDWNNEKRLTTMKSLLDQKFSFKRNPELVKKLLDTGNLDLIEGNNWEDVFWGVSNGTGENQLGKMLMKIRDEQYQYREAVRHTLQENPKNRDGIAEFFKIDRKELYRWIQIFDLRPVS